MESTGPAESAQPTPASPTTSRGPRQRGGENQHRRGGPRGDRGRGEYRGRGRGQSFRGNVDRNNQPRPQFQPQTNPAALSIPAVSAERTNGESVTQKPAEEGQEGDVEAEVCFICASPVVHNSVAHCNHRTCHICSLRMRALYKNKACLHCRTNSDFVIFTDDPNKRFEDFTDQDFARVDDNLGIKYEKPDIFEDTVLLLRYNCPEESCDIACYGWPDLHRHVRNVHNKVMCDLCTRNKKVFTHEHELFTHNELRRHEKYGDDQPGAVDQSGFKGHPECGFCHERFYGDDELYTHCRDRHERCHICDRRNQGRAQQYFLDYNALEVHFKKDHFLCPDQECLDKKFVVFESEMDLKAHQLEAHPNGLTKDARRDARRVDMSGFDYRAPHQEPRGGRREGREGRGRGRGRDPNVEALPASSAQPMRRDELAFQRQLAIHSAQSISNRTFGGELTSGDAYAARAPANAPEPATITAPRGNDRPQAPAPAQTPVTQPTVAPPAPMTAAEQARTLRHAAVTERATNLLQHSAPKLTTFRQKVSDYRTNALTGEALIDALFALIDAPSSDIGTLIKELAEIFEVPGKRDGLLKAWSDWRAINEDYPSLPGPNGLPAGGSSNAGSGGKRILKLKSSTAQSSRTALAAAKQSTWAAASGGGGGGAASLRGNFFPSLSVPVNRTGPGKVTTAAWTTPAASASNTNARPSPAPSRAASTRPPAADMFPGLPAAQKPGMNVSRPGFAGNPVLKGRSGTSTPVSAWASGGGPSVGGLSAALDGVGTGEQEEDDAVEGKRKGKKKQTLYHWG